MLEKKILKELTQAVIDESRRRLAEDRSREVPAVTAAVLNEIRPSDSGEISQMILIGVGFPESGTGFDGEISYKERETILHEARSALGFNGGCKVQRKRREMRLQSKLKFAR